MATIALESTSSLIVDKSCSGVTRALHVLLCRLSGGVTRARIWLVKCYEGTFDCIRPCVRVLLAIAATATHLASDSAALSEREKGADGSGPPQQPETAPAHKL